MLPSLPRTWRLPCSSHAGRSVSDACRPRECRPPRRSKRHTRVTATFPPPNLSAAGGSWPARWRCSGQRCSFSRSSQEAVRALRPQRRRRRRCPRSPPLRARAPRHPRACSPTPPLADAPASAPAVADAPQRGRRSSQSRRRRQQLDATRFVDQTQTHIPDAGWKASIRSTRAAQDVRRQLAAARLDPQAGDGVLDRPTTYHGLNFARCCGGPMQFNVTNGPGHHLGSSSGRLRYGAAPGGLRPPDRHAPVDLRRLRLDHGGRAAALLRRRRRRARRDGVGRGVRLLRARRRRRHLRRPGAGARDRLVPARLLHQLRRGTGAGRSGARRVRRAGARALAAARRLRRVRRARAERNVAAR